MKLHTITWILLAAAGVQLAVLAANVLGIAYAAGEASRMSGYGGVESGILQAWLGQSLGDALRRLGGIVVNAGLAGWVEFLSRTYRDLRAGDALGEA
ncbi:hypothetical protein AS593_10600 [Caulobacter vibrioides]|nr:hypothetical protein AS593_10600 [Caulobacter vibrioides]